MKKQGKRFVAMMAAMFLTQTVCSFPQGIVHAKAQTMEKSQIELSDQDIANLYQTTGYNWQSVHDPSIVATDEASGRVYRVFGSHMGVAKTTDLMNWSAVTNETPDSTLFGTVQENGTITPVSYQTAFSDNAVKGTTVLYTQNGETYTVDFGTYNINEWLSPSNIQGNMWAPDVIYNPIMNKWCMYLSLNGPSWNSAVLLLTSDQVEGPYVYQGPVVFSGFQSSNNITQSGTVTRSYKNTDLELVLGELATLPEKYDKGNQWGTFWPHAIDPCVFYDDNGKLWMSYGSWSGGIYVLELDERTGFRDYSVNYASDYDQKGASVTTDAYFGKKIAGGYYSSGEGSYIEKIGSKYCLFMSYGFYSPEGGYEMRVFYSDNPDGPYTDTAGISAIYTNYQMNYGPNAVTNRGQKILGNYRWDTMVVPEIAQGHNSAFVDSDGRAYVIYHTKFDDGMAGHQLRVHELFQTKSGYLLASPYEYSNQNAIISSTTSYDSASLTGSYDVIVHKYKTKCEEHGDETEVIEPVKVTLNNNGTITGEMTGTWTNEAGSPYAVFVLDGKTYHGIFVRQNVTGTNTNTMCFTLLDPTTGLCVWGSHELEDSVSVAKSVNSYEMTQAVMPTTYTDLQLPSETEDGAIVNWVSSNPSIISNSGVVTAPTQDTTVTMTAQISKGNYYYTKSYTTTVKAGGIQNADCTSNLEAVYDFEGSLVNGINASEIGAIKNSGMGRFPKYQYDKERDGYVLHQYFGDINNASYAEFVNPLKGEALQGATVSLWVKRFGTEPLLDAIWSFLDIDNTDGVEGRLYLTPNAYIGYNGTGGWFDCNHPSTVITNAIAVREWNFVTVTFSDSGFGIYVNGHLLYTQTQNEALASSADISSMYQSVLNLLSSADHFYLGYGSWWGSAPLLMDNLKIYSRALNESDVAKLYLEELNGEETVNKNNYFYYEDYNNINTISSVWSSINANDSLTLNTDSDKNHLKYVQFATGNANSRSAYTPFTINHSLSDCYTVEFDTKLSAGNNQETQLALTNTEYQYSGNNTNNGIGNGYIWKMSTTNNTEWTITGGGIVTIPKDVWVHIRTDISRTQNIAKIKITNGNTVLYSGTIPYQSTESAAGIYVLNGRYYAVTCFDNVEVKTSLADGLIGEYLFQNSLVDSLHPNQYAALVQSTSEDTKSVITTDPIGSRGSVMEMNGTWQATGYLEMPLGYLNTIENGFTVSMWAKANNSKSVDGICGTEASLFNFKTTPDSWTDDVLGYTPGFVSLDVSLHPWINDYHGNWVDRADTAIHLSSEKWQQIIMSIDGTQNQIYVYIDGKLAETVTLGGGTCASLLSSIKSNTTAIQIGTCLPWWNVWDFRGYVDDIRFYNKALSTREAQELYQISADESVVIQ